jgi:hypothetical protein
MPKLAGKCPVTDGYYEHCTFPFVRPHFKPLKRTTNVPLQSPINIAGEMTPRTKVTHELKVVLLSQQFWGLLCKSFVSWQ